MGENVEMAIRREVEEEVGMTDYEPVRITSYVFDSARERELVYVHITRYDGEVKPDREELDGGKFWSPAELQENMGKGVFTPNFEQEYRDIVLPYLQEQKS